MSSFALFAVFCVTCLVGVAGKRHSFVREYLVDGKPVRLSADETDLDLAKIYPDAEKDRWASVEAKVESTTDRKTRLYYRNEWFGDLRVNGEAVRLGFGGPGTGFEIAEIGLRRGENVISLRTRAGNRGWHCALAFDRQKTPGEPDAAVDFGADNGRIRPLLHSSGFGPMICSFPKESKEAILSMNFAAARTHDWALINPNERVCDYFHVFPLMHLDATKEENYHFGPTDYLLKQTRETMGLDIFYRLGTSIEHSGPKVHFNTLIPGDFDKVAEIFAGTVRHYNRGWANGYRWNIKYWEIWNEPDGINNMWCLPDGDRDTDPMADAEKSRVRREKFATFFVTCLKRLKAEFPDVKVGGPALCVMNESYFKALLKACRDASVAPDFISWHYYGSDVEAILGGIARARKLCDSYGFTACELVLNEWHFMGCSFPELRSSDPAVQQRVWQGPSSHNGTDSAAFTLSVLARFQTSALDQGYYYGCRHTGPWGFMDDFKRRYKVYHALKAFGDVVKGFPRLGEVKTTDSVTTMVARSEDMKQTALLVVDYRGREGDVVLDVRSPPAGLPKVRVLDHTRDFEEIAVKVDGQRLILPKSGSDSASYLLTWRVD